MSNTSDIYVKCGIREHMRKESRKKKKDENIKKGKNFCSS